MSKSGSDSRVEDVLTSVRRLVSSELPRNRRPDLPAGPGALVLTDAQRVGEGPGSRTARRSLEERIAELEVAVSARGGEFEPDGSEDQSQHRPDRIVYSRPPSDEEQAEARRGANRLSRIALVAEDNSEEVAAASPAPRDAPAFRHGSAAGQGREPERMGTEPAPMAEDVPAAAHRGAEISAFTRPEDVIDRIEARLRGNPVPDRPATAAAAPAPGQTPVPESPSAAEPEVTGAAGEDQSDEAFAAALDAAVQTRPEAQTGPETAEEAQGTDEAPAQENAGSDSEASAVPAGDAALEDILDDDFLRPIVARLIREEFQGELGERITRNIRKLVRREVLRAISSKSVE